MNKIVSNNKMIARFMGYTHVYENIQEDFSDCGGLYTHITVYSKVPIEIKTYGEGEEFPMRVIDNKEWMDKRQEFFTIRESGYFCESPDELLYHKDWNWLMPVMERCALYQSMYLVDSIVLMCGKHAKNITDLWNGVVTFCEYLEECENNKKC